MNRYAVEGVLRDARSGKRILWVELTERGARQALADVEAAVGADAVKIVRGIGREKVTLPGGGAVTFVSVLGTGYRGQSADVIYIAGGAYDALCYVDRLADLLPAIAASEHGEVIRAW